VIIILPFLLYIIKGIHIDRVEGRKKKFLESEMKIRERIKELNGKFSEKVQKRLK
jgi:hypothetical protein